MNTNQTNRNNKQPRALFYLFMTELWERFSYWSVQSLIVLYMTQHLGFNDSKAYLIYGAFGALMMATPVIGGYIADHLIGYNRAVILGGLCLMLGYASLAVGQFVSFYVGMSACIIGNGLLKPNISTLLGTCYKNNDKRRESGFTIFYFGINAGSILGTIACGFVAELVSYQWAFALASSAMVIGLIVFSTGIKRVHSDQIHKHHRLEQITQAINQKTFLVVIACIIIIGLLYLCLLHPDIANSIIIIFGVLLLSYLGYQYKRTKKILRGRFLAAIILTIMSVGFWALYMQMPMSLTLFVARAVNLNIFGYSIPPSTVTALNSFFILAFAPVAVKVWRSLKTRDRDLSFGGKFSLGLLFIGLGFLALTYGAFSVTPLHQSSLFPVVFGYLGLTLGELALSPIGLAMITLYSPPRLRGFMMGTWFFALAASTAIAGQLAKIASIPNKSMSIVSISKIYGHAFIIFAAICFVTALLLMAITPWLKKIAATQPHSAKKDPDAGIAEKFTSESITATA
ncbi:MAG: peptide MFS transporter [Coxiellaceae bacterium]|nr:peptide MFS transporter [Coxiellaceae bacterium]